MAARLGGGALGFGRVQVPALRGCDLFDGCREGSRLLDDHYVILTVLAQMQLGKVKAFYTGSLELERDPSINDMYMCPYVCTSLCVR